MRIIVLIYFAVIISLSFLLFQDPKLDASIQRGSEIYADFCVTCHMSNGEGVANTFPPLAKSDYLMNNREACIKGIKYGQQGELTVNGIVYNNSMDKLGLDDEEIADVMNYILNSWGNSSDQMVTLGEVEAITE